MEQALCNSQQAHACYPCRGSHSWRHLLFIRWHRRCWATWSVGCTFRTIARRGRSASPFILNTTHTENNSKNRDPIRSNKGFVRRCSPVSPSRLTKTHVFVKQHDVRSTRLKAARRGRRLGHVDQEEAGDHTGRGGQRRRWRLQRRQRQWHAGTRRLPLRIVRILLFICFAVRRVVSAPTGVASLDERAGAPG